MPRWNLAAKRPWLLRNMSRKLLIVAVAVSVTEFYTQGRVSWPDTAIREADHWVRLSSNDLDLPNLKELPGALGIENAVPSPTGRPVTVKRVIDGDTIELLGGERIRLQGIDTPERSQDYGSQSTRALKKYLIGDVTLQRIETDRYGRTIGVLFVGHEEVNLKMVCEGHAWHYAQYAPDRHDMAECQSQAKAQKIGLWTSGSPTPPWEFRR